MATFMHNLIKVAEVGLISKFIAIATESVVTASQTEYLMQVKYCLQSDARNLQPVETNDTAE